LTNKKQRTYIIRRWGCENLPK